MEEQILKGVDSQLVELLGDPGTDTLKTGEWRRMNGMHGLFDV